MTIYQEKKWKTNNQKLQSSTLKKQKHLIVSRKTKPNRKENTQCHNSIWNPSYFNHTQNT